MIKFYFPPAGFGLWYQLGVLHKIKRLVKYIENKEGIVKVNPILKSIFPFLIFFTAPKKDVIQTINNE